MVKTAWIPRPASLCLDPSPQQKISRCQILFHPYIQILCGHNGGRVVYYLHVHTGGAMKLRMTLFIADAVALWGAAILAGITYGWTTAFCWMLFAFYLKGRD